MTPLSLLAPAAGPGASAPALRRAAQAFEEQALGALLQPMFEGLGQGGPFGGGPGEAQWRPMLVAEYGKAITRAGGVGLTDAVLASLRQVQEGGVR